MNDLEKEAETNSPDEDQAQATLSQPIIKEGFQMIVSKRKKKNQKKNFNLAKDTYMTRSKVTPKPFR